MEDETIIDLYFAREERAIAETGKKYGGYCRSIAFNILHSHEDTEECVSDTWLHTWNAIPPTRPGCLRAFLGRITRNLSFTRWEAARAQKRGGRGISAMATREEDFAEVLFTASSHDFIMFYSNLGKVYKLKGYQIPETSRTAKGMNIVNLLELDPGEKITAMFPTSDYQNEETQDKFLFFATERGTVKRISLNDLGNIRRGGLRVLSLNEGDSVVNVCMTSGDQTIMLISRNGQVVSFKEEEVRPMGRTAVGVRGIQLAEDDKVVGMVCGDPDTMVLTVTENGYGKCTPVEDYSIHHRGGRGMIAHGLTQKTGMIAGVAAVTDEDDVMLITDGGVIIRTAVSDIRVCGRSSQGVIVMRTSENGKVISLARTDPEQEDDSETDE